LYHQLSRKLTFTFHIDFDTDLRAGRSSLYKTGYFHIFVVCYSPVPSFA